MNFLLRMNPLLHLSILAALLPAALLAPQSSVAQEEMREGKTYVGITGTRLNHRSIDEDLTGQGWSSMGALILGTHVSEHFHAELRAGSGLAAGKIDDQLEVDIEYFASWYFGGHYPVTDYSNVYGQFGFTHVKGESALLPGVQNSGYEDIADMKYPDSSFSTSWLIGLDIETVDNAFIILEGGKFFEDTGTNANVFQFSLGAKYEF